MKKYLKIILLLAVIFLVVFGVREFVSKNSKTNLQNGKSTQQISTTLKISDETGSEPFDISGFEGKTALAATQAEAKTITTGTGTDAFVTSINGRAADSKKHEFWELDANGIETQVGAGSYIVQKGDLIVWRINTY